MMILIVEDDEGIAELIREKLEECGFETAHSKSAAEAYAWLMEHNPHIMLLDFTLPDMNAKEFIAELQKKEKSVPSFIISTGQGDERIAVDMMKLGARDYIVKDSLFLEMLPEVIKRVDHEIENEKKIIEAENNYRLLAENACDVIWILDTNDLHFRYVSPSIEKLRGYSIEEVMGQTLEQAVCPESFARLSALLPEGIKLFMEGSTEDRTAEIEQGRKDGSTVWTEASFRFVQNKANGHLEIIGASRDISERKQAEEEIRTLLAEKELILKEVHHRIKNNMSTIASLLSLQAGTLKDPLTVQALEDAESRIGSMMILYDKLYHSSDFNRISIRGYLPSLIDEITGNFPNVSFVKIEKNIEDFILDAKKLQPLGIIANELITNIMKYAFTLTDSDAVNEAVNQAVIKVSASLHDNMVTLIISDNGIGMPEGIDFTNTTGFGLMLVGGLTKQLKGTIRIERGNGTRFVLEFKK